MSSVGCQTDKPGTAITEGDGSSKRRKLWCSRLGVSLLIVLAAVVVAVFRLRQWEQEQFVLDGIVDDIGVEGIVLFRKHDRDNDGYLSLEEFEPLAHHLRNINVSTDHVRLVLQYSHSCGIELRMYVRKELNSSIVQSNSSKTNAITTRAIVFV